MVVHSTTKYIGGHSDVVGGAVVLRDGLQLPEHVTPFFDSRDAAEELTRLQMTLGAIESPRDAFLAHRGLKTLAVRVERHCTNTQAVGRVLAGPPQGNCRLLPGPAQPPRRHRVGSAAKTR